ncbi:hypothetical protein B0H65DRAFT_436327, partial [Neurospora tetraspora]
DNTDPKYFYDYICKTVSKVINKIRTNIFEKYITLYCGNFNSISSFFIRYNLLRKRITKYSLKIDNKVKVLNFYNIVKR